MVLRVEAGKKRKKWTRTFERETHGQNRKKHRTFLVVQIL